MIRVLTLLAQAYRLRRVRKLLVAGRVHEARRTLAALERAHSAEVAT